MLQYKEDARVIRFVTGLNDEFAMVRSQILLMEPLPPLNKAFSMVIQFERQPGLCVEETENSAIISAADGRRTQSYGRGRGYSNKICTFCGKTGHTVETCYKKHGFPPGFRFKGSNYNAGNASNNAVNNEENEAQTDQNSVVKESASLTQDEYKALMTLLRPLL